MKREIMKFFCWCMLFFSMCMTIEVSNWYACMCVVVAACLFVIKVECK